MRKAIMLMIVSLVTILAIASATPMESEKCCYQPLYNYTRENLTGKHEWYFIVVFGDNRPANISSTEFPEEFLKILNEAEKLNPSAIIGTGDHVGKGTEKQYIELWKTMSSLHNVILVPGNHDELISGSIERWEKYVGPRYWVWEEIPGWSIIGVDTATKLLPEFRAQVENVFNESNSPHRILVIHYPIEPLVGHNIDKAPSGFTKKRILLSYIENYNVSLVLQGHWHGYAVREVGGTAYVITGGAGAPFYEIETGETNADYYRTHVPHYLIVLLWPNGEYKLFPIYLSKGNITVKYINNYIVSIFHNKYFINGSEATIPVRVTLEKDGTQVEVHLLVPYGEHVNLSLMGDPPTLNVEGNAVMLDTAYLPSHSSMSKELLVLRNNKNISFTNSTNVSAYSHNGEISGKGFLTGETLLAVTVVIVLVLLRKYM